MMMLVVELLVLLLFLLLLFCSFLLCYVMFLVLACGAQANDWSVRSGHALNHKFVTQRQPQHTLQWPTTARRNVLVHVPMLFSCCSFLIFLMFLCYAVNVNVKIILIFILSFGILNANHSFWKIFFIFLFLHVTKPQFKKMIHFHEDFD